jgi:hypothetical protein
MMHLGGPHVEKVAQIGKNIMSALPEDPFRGGRHVEVVAQIGTKIKSAIPEDSLQSQINAPETFHLPCDLYGLFVAEPLQLNADVDGHVIVALVMFRLCFFVVVNYVIQMLYIGRINKLALDLEGNQCDNTHMYMQLVCVFVFTTSIFREFRDALNLAHLLIRAPTEQYQTIDTQHGAVLLAHEDRLAGKGTSSFVDKLSSWQRSRSEFNVERKWTLDAMSKGWKVGCLLLLVFPRMMVTLLLTKVGTGFIVRASEEFMIADTVAALFIVEIDHFIYHAFTTHAVQQQLEGMKTLKVQFSNLYRVSNFFSVNFLCPLGILIFTFSVVWSARLVCAEEESFIHGLKHGLHHHLHSS